MSVDKLNAFISNSFCFKWKIYQIVDDKCVFKVHKASEITVLFSNTEILKFDQNVRFETVFCTKLWFSFNCEMLLLLLKIFFWLWKSELTWILGKFLSYKATTTWNKFTIFNGKWNPFLLFSWYCPKNKNQKFFYFSEFSCKFCQISDWQLQKILILARFRYPGFRNRSL